MGGTSFDVAVVRNSIPSLTTAREIAFGIPISIPMLDITTIGAGGGSIARVEKGGMLRVGPESAGADPGPACYGKQQFLPTVTDAHLVLGRINPQSTLGRGGEAGLNREWASKAIQEKIAKPLGLKSVEEAAQAIIAVSNSSMAACIKLLTIDKGIDPAHFTLIAFGGAGPLHAAFLAQELGIPHVLIPRGASVFSAYGCLLAEVKHTVAEIIDLPLAQVTWDRVLHFFTQQKTLGERVILETDPRENTLQVIYVFAVSYEGQPRPLALRFALLPTKEELCARFAERYQQRYGEILEDFPLFLHSLRLLLVGDVTQRVPQFPPITQKYRAMEEALIETRSVFFAGNFLQTPIYHRAKLLPAQRLNGPVVIEEEGATTVVPPGVSIVMDQRGHLHMEVTRDVY
jgi:N-methylhydantoinase A